MCQMQFSQSLSQANAGQWSRVMTMLCGVSTEFSRALHVLNFYLRKYYQVGKIIITANLFASNKHLVCTSKLLV